MMKQISTAKPKKQQGAVLIVALVMLVILTILGVTIMENSVVEERMAGNLLDSNLTFQAAEAALREGEAWIDRQIDYPEPVDGKSVGGVSFVDTIDGGNTTWWEQDDSWWEANSTEYAASLAGIDPNPRYIIEEYDYVFDSLTDQTLTNAKIIYRVTAVAWGGRNTTVMLQSLYARRY